MTQPNTKKLITGFLLLTTLLASGGLIVANLFEAKNARDPQSLSDRQASRSNTQSAPANAFNENPAGAPAIPVTAPGDIAEPNSLTDRFAKVIAEQIQNQNPRGPMDQNGVLGADIPDLDTAVARLAGDPQMLASARESVRIPLPKVPPSSVIENFSEDDVVRFAKGFGDALNVHINDPKLLAIVDGAPTPEAVLAVQAALQTAVRELSALRTPRPFKNLNDAAIKALAYTRDLANLEGTGDDPLRGALAYTIREERAQSAIDQLSYEARNIRIDRTTDAGERELAFVAWFREALGIKIARAQLPSGQILPTEWLGAVSAAIVAAAGGIAAKTTLTLGQKIKNFLSRLATEFFKDFLIHRLVRQVVVWLQGGGKPQFMTDWKGFLTNAANAAVGNALYELNPQFCASFGPLIRVALLPVVPAADKPVLCSLTQIVGNVKEFADDFTNGGWVAYGAALQPQNNFFGALIEMKGFTDREALGAAHAAQNDAESSGGWLSTKMCVSWADYIPDNCGALATCQPERRCKRYENTTPGNALGHTVYDALGSPIHRIVNADDITALISALLNAGLTKLVGMVKDTDPDYPSETPGLAGLNVNTIGSPSSTAPDFSGCSAVDASQQAACILQVCQATGWTQPPC